MIRPLFRLLAALATFVALSISALSMPALAADKAIIILDASGSMWAQINGKPRIEIARDVLKDVLSGVPSDLELGFMAYGHRSKGDCNDIEMLVDPAPGTAEQIIAAADGLSPKGKTPLSAAVQQAAEKLKYTEDKATVVLITDGIETCEADPCALASALEKDGIDFTVNVVGFGLSEADGAKVKCLADNTHGVYLSADDEDGLKEAITTAVTTAPAPAPEEPVAPPVEPSTDITFAPTAVLSEGGDPLLEGDGNIAWEFYQVNADGSQGEWVRTEYGNAYQGAIDPGNYLINAKLDYAHIQMPVTIEAGKTAKPQFDLEAGFIDIKPYASEGAEIENDAAVYTEFPDGTSTTSYGEVKSFVPAGTTKISASIGNAKVDDSVTVAAGEHVTKDVIVGAGHVTVTGSYADGVNVEDGNLFVNVVEAKKDIQGDRKDVSGAYGPAAEFDLPAGDYVAIGSYDVAKVEQPFTVKAGEASTVNINLNAGVLAVSAPNAYFIEVLAPKKDIQGNRASYGGTYDVTATRTLPAGDYHVIVTYEGGAAAKEADATVKAGERNEITVQ